MAPATDLENFVDGGWLRARATGRLDVFDPSDGSVLARVPRSGEEDVDAAVRAARAAFPSWRDVPVPDRARRVLALRSLLEEHAETLARSIVRENGKTSEEARGSVRRGIEATDFAASAPTTMQGSFLEDVATGIDTTLVRQPLGVVAGITPFNFPIMIPLWMAPLALVCGNCFILKPSERVPLSPSLLPPLFEKAGFPAGSFSLVHGDADAVNAILTHPGINAVSFVGSAPTARHIYTTAAAHGKRVQALAGAKNHMIVMPDADLERSVPAIVSSAFGMAGQRCLAGSVVEAVEPGADRLVERLIEAVRDLSVGPGTPPELRSDRSFGPTFGTRSSSGSEMGRRPGPKWSLGAPRRPARAGTSSLPCSSTTCAPRCQSPRRRSSAPYSLSSERNLSTKPSRTRIDLALAMRQRSSPRTERPRESSRDGSKRGW